MAWLTFAAAIAVSVISYIINGQIVKSYSQMVPKAMASGMDNPATDSVAIRSWFFHATDLASCLPSAVLTAVAYTQLDWALPQVASPVILLVCTVFIVILCTFLRSKSSARYAGDLSLFDISIFAFLIFLFNLAGLIVSITCF